MELVPFSAVAGLTGSGTKLDLKAIYRRPDPRGITLTSPLPFRRHEDWQAKGFEFVTLATLGDLGEAANTIRAHGHDPLRMRDCYDRNGHFDVAKYLKQAQVTDAARLVDLQAKVDKFGAEAVTELMRVSDPTFTLPEGIVVAAAEPVKGKAK